jgi:V8-like Glu-specific endopeptidase
MNSNSNNDSTGRTPVVARHRTQLRIQRMRRALQQDHRLASRARSSREDTDMNATTPRTRAGKRAAIALFVSIISVSGVAVLDSGVATADGPPPPGAGADGSATAGYLHPLTPARVLDTRSGVGADGPVGAGRSIEVQVTGRGGVPAGAGAVVLNVTVTQPTTSGYVTVYPSGSDRPTASNLNFRPGQTVPNLVVAKLGEGGTVTLFNSHGSSHLIADVMGWYDDIFASFPALPEGGSRQRGIDPVRILDTREQGDAIGAGEELELRVAGAHGVPAGATAVAMNVTVTRPTSGGFLTVYPAGSDRPDASNLNFTPGQTVPNMVVAKLGANGSVRLFNSHGASHVIVDVTSYFEPAEPLAGGELNAAAPARVLDTREGLGAAAGKVGPGESISLQLAGEGGIPATNVDSVVLNVTATDPTAAGFVTVHPAGTERPTASNLNVLPGQTVANLVVAKVGADGRVTLFNSHGSVHLIADVTGWFNADTTTSGPPVDSFRMQESTDSTATAETSIGMQTASELDPSFAADQEAFWSEHDPQQVLAESSPEQLLERDDTSVATDRLVEYGNDAGVKYQIWSQGYSYPNHNKAIGRLLFWVPSEGRWSNCTATMVARNLAITAAHCVADQSGRFTNLAFFGGLEGTTAHGGIHTNVIDTIIPSVGAVPAYLTTEFSYAADYAFVQFGTDGTGRYPGDSVGWFGLKVNPQLNWLLSYGYPSEGSYFGSYCSTPRSQMDAACYMYQTWGRYGGYQQYTQGWYEIGWGSDMTGGSSGGPVFAYENGAYSIVSVNSNGRSEFVESNGQRGFVLNMWGPYFNQTMLDIYYAYAAR